MKTSLSILLVFIITVASHAHQKLDSPTKNTSSTTTLLDTDSLNQTLQHLPDSLLPSFHRIDSIRKHFNNMADSLQKDYQTALSVIDAETRNINNALDSAAALNLPTGKYTARLDSMNSLRLDASKKFTARLQDLKSKTTSGLNSLDLPPEYQEPLNQLTTKINTLNPDAEIVTIPEFQIPGYAPPDINAENLVSRAGDVGNVNSLAKLPELETPIGNLGQRSEQASAYKQDIQNLTQGNIEDVERLNSRIGLNIL